MRVKTPEELFKNMFGKGSEGGGDSRATAKAALAKKKAKEEAEKARAEARAEEEQKAQDTAWPVRVFSTTKSQRCTATAGCSLLLGALRLSLSKMRQEPVY